MSNLIRLPHMFYQDHVDRGLEAPSAIKWTTNHVFVYDDAPGLTDLLSDADFYADAYGPGAGMPEYFGLKSSARATARAIRKAIRDRRG